MPTKFLNYYFSRYGLFFIFLAKKIWILNIYFYFWYNIWILNIDLLFFPSKNNFRLFSHLNSFLISFFGQKNFFSLSQCARKKIRFPCLTYWGDRCKRQHIYKQRGVSSLWLLVLEKTKVIMVIYIRKFTNKMFFFFR